MAELGETRPSNRQSGAAMPSTSDGKSIWGKLFGKNHDEVSRTEAETTIPRADGHEHRLRRTTREVVPGIPRPGTFRRQQSEQRERLAPISLSDKNTRPRSVGAESTSRTASGPVLDLPTAVPRSSACAFGSAYFDSVPGVESVLQRQETRSSANEDTAPGNTPIAQQERGTIQEELESRWILNLSMHFRDRSRREKFFVTYAASRQQWHRVTISMDYRNAQAESLEAEVYKLVYQRDKSARIYEAIRDSLSEIKFYDSVTNLKLETLNGRIHVHVTEDVNETVIYPPVSAIGHLDCPKVRETDLVFDSHLSGFVYKVIVDGVMMVKKEIPGPDTVEEFLYELNALCHLKGSSGVIRLKGVVIDEQDSVLKGLLIDYASEGALVDILYDKKGQLSWSRRQRWARQIVEGLSEIHEAGVVQGDFTLSNIVVDMDDNAQIIDINRRGCPVGWEPPEIVKLLESRQQIAMYIGVKSDLYQLGMVLWSIATQNDEPEIQRRPLNLGAGSEIPEYYEVMVGICLSDRPQDRVSAATLLHMFPQLDDEQDVAISRGLSVDLGTTQIASPVAGDDCVDTPSPECITNEFQGRLSLAQIKIDEVPLRDRSVASEDGQNAADEVVAMTYLSEKDMDNLSYTYFEHDTRLLDRIPPYSYDCHIGDLPVWNSEGMATHGFDIGSIPQQLEIEEL